MVDNLQEKSRGSGFFDVSQNNFGPRQSPVLETKNSFGKLQDEEECYDTEFGLWEKEMLLVRKFYEADTCPPDDVFTSWSDKMKDYYVMLTKFDPVKEAMVETSVENEVEVESETDESARDIVRGGFGLWRVALAICSLFVISFLNIINKRFARGFPSFP
ncbi:hypothetical protein HanPI659440_Chr07g0266501 [Helianthus annuus]|nr:hypothetical protein HanPI659440_Chr07g0266501 [Helianthus annuus]